MLQGLPLPIGQAPQNAFGLPPELKQALLQKALQSTITPIPDFPTGYPIPPKYDERNITTVEPKRDEMLRTTIDPSMGLPDILGDPIQPKPSDTITTPISPKEDEMLRSLPTPLGDKPTEGGKVGLNIELPKDKQFGQYKLREDEFESETFSPVVYVNPAKLKGEQFFVDNKIVEQKKKAILTGEKIKPIVIKNGKVIDGYHTADALTQLGYKEIPAVFVETYDKEYKETTKDHKEHPSIVSKLSPTEGGKVDPLTESARKAVAEGKTVYRGGDKINPLGIWVSPSKEFASEYGKVTKYKMPKDINLLDVNSPEADDIYEKFGDDAWYEPTKGVVKAVKKLGYDGFENGDNILIFDQTKIQLSDKAKAEVGGTNDRT